MVTPSARHRLDARLALSSLKHRAGRGYVYARDHWFDPSTRRVVRERLRLMASRTLSRSDVLDWQFGRPLSQVSAASEWMLSPKEVATDRPPWEVSLDREPCPIDRAEECFRAHGVWPISFSYPGVPMEVVGEPAQLVSAIFPGVPYSFDDQWEYMRTYQEAYLGLTHRKAGWDCFRHVEIMASGAIPLMPDAHEIPGYSMVHYPKRALAEVVRVGSRKQSPPGHATRRAFRDWFDTHLTSAAMARYLLGASGLSGVERVLFVDAALPGFADYQSVLTLIGLKQLLGPNCHVLHPVDYIYDDTTIATASLYGRGFGYTRVVDGALRSATEYGKEADPASFDAVVVGSVSRNASLARDLLSKVGAKRTIWVHGEDGAPTMDETHEMRSTGVNLFVRAIHTGRTTT